MRHLRISIFVLLAGTVYLGSILSSRAGGSIAWTQVHDEIAKDDPFLIAFLDKTLEMARAGGALRVGRDKDGNSLVEGLEVGTRIPPFEFLARPKGTTGDYTLHVSLEPSEAGDQMPHCWVVHIRKRIVTD